ncbi:MAG TPA: replicative DNA helicase [Candidatus Paceibacterota bacterium]|nr:replicative DNA helicase [Candidatus Paceibacterota bacterium]HPT40334.1 replicative DNA helicase [Candidatus Paceibacterota bacterium]
MAETKNQINKIPPQNIEAEQSVLGSLMIDKDAVIKIADFLQPTDFYKPSHQKVYETMLELYQRHEPIDILSLPNRLKDKGFLQDIGGISYLTSLTNMVPTASSIVSYAKIVQQKKLLRDLIGAAYDISELGFQEDRDVEDLLDEVEQKIFSVTQKSISGQQFKDIKEDLTGAFDKIEKLHRGEKPLRGIGTGYKQLDHMLSGMQKSDLLILAARPSLGKTSLALNIALHAAMKEKASVGIFSLEMSREQLVDRLISAESGIDLWKIRTGNLKEEEQDFEYLHQALDRLSRAPIYIDDAATSNIMRLRTMARRLQADRGLDLIIIDYLQLITPRDNKAFNMVQQITEISRGLKALARELNVPIIALSQLSRAVEQRDHKMPRLSDLRESGSIEQDADVVMFIYRKDRDKIDEDLTEEEKNTAKIIVAKHRNGPTGEVDLKFIPTLVSFRDIDKSFDGYNNEEEANAAAAF